MNCRANERLLLAERDGVLTSDQQASFERHVASCHTCQQLRARLAAAMIAFRDDTVKVTVPDSAQAWEQLRAQRLIEISKPAKKRPLAPVIWLGTSLAAAAALAFAFFGHEPQSPATDSLSASTEIAQADYVEAGDPGASTMVYVDKESGWLVVWASNGDATTEG